MTGAKRGLALLRSWMLIVVGAVLGVLVAGVYTLAVTPEYESTARAFLSTTADSTTGPDLANSQTFVAERIKSYSQLIDSPVVLYPVIQRLKLDITVEDLAKQIEVDVPLNSVVLSVTVTDENKRTASAIANQIMDQLPLVVARVEDPLGAKTAVPVTFAVFDKARPATDASSPRKSLNLAAGLVLGAVVGFGAFTVLRRRNAGSRGTARRVNRPALRSVSSRARS